MFLDKEVLCFLTLTATGTEVSVSGGYTPLP